MKNSELKKALDFLREDYPTIPGLNRYSRYVRKKLERKKFNRAFEFFKDKNVIDIGSHIGFYASISSIYASNVIAIDLNDDLLEAGKVFIEKLKIDNIVFEKKDMYTLDDKYFEKHNINAVLLHKIYGNTQWSEDQSKNIFNLIRKYCDVAIFNKKEEVFQEFLDDPNFTFQEIAYGSRSLFVITRK